MLERKFSKQQEYVRTNYGLNSVKRSNLLHIFVECTTESRKLQYQSRKNILFIVIYWCDTHREQQVNLYYRLKPCLQKLLILQNNHCGKASGAANLPPDLIKTCKSSLQLPLHDIYCQCWQEVEILQDMRDALNNQSV